MDYHEAMDYADSYIITPPQTDCDHHVNENDNDDDDDTDTENSRPSSLFTSARNLCTSSTSTIPLKMNTLGSLNDQKIPFITDLTSTLNRRYPTTSLFIKANLSPPILHCYTIDDFHTPQTFSSQPMSPTTTSMVNTHATMTSPTTNSSFDDLEHFLTISPNHLSSNVTHHTINHPYSHEVMINKGGIVDEYDPQSLALDQLNRVMQYHPYGILPRRTLIGYNENDESDHEWFNDNNDKVNNDDDDDDDDDDAIGKEQTNKHKKPKHYTKNLPHYLPNARRNIQDFIFIPRHHRNMNRSSLNVKMQKRLAAVLKDINNPTTSSHSNNPHQIVDGYDGLMYDDDSSYQNHQMNDNNTDINHEYNNDNGDKDHIISNPSDQNPHPLARKYSALFQETFYPILSHSIYQYHNQNENLNHPSSRKLAISPILLTFDQLYHIDQKISPVQFREQYIVVIRFINSYQNPNSSTISSSPNDPQLHLFNNVDGRDLIPPDDLNKILFEDLLDDHHEDFTNLIIQYFHQLSIFIQALIPCCTPFTEEGLGYTIIEQLNLRQLTFSNPSTFYSASSPFSPKKLHLIVHLLLTHDSSPLLNSYRSCTASMIPNMNEKKTPFNRSNQALLWSQAIQVPTLIPDQTTIDIYHCQPLRCPIDQRTIANCHKNKDDDLQTLITQYQHDISIPVPPDDDRSKVELTIAKVFSECQPLIPQHLPGNNSTSSQTHSSSLTSSHPHVDSFNMSSLTAAIQKIEASVKSINTSRLIPIDDFYDTAWLYHQWKGVHKELYDKLDPNA